MSNLGQLHLKTRRLTSQPFARNAIHKRPRISPLKKSRLLCFAVATAALATALNSCDRMPLDSSTGASELTMLPLSRTDVAADDLSQVEVRAQIRIPVSGSATSVTFASTAGTFTASGTNVEQAVADSAGLATVVLRSPRNPVSAVVTASHGPSMASQSITFVRAYPDTIELEPSQFVIHADSTAEITATATLRRKSGLVSPGTPVGFSATIGEFGVPPLSDDSGSARIRYTTGPVSSTLLDTLYAHAIRNDTIDSSDTATVSGSTIVRVLP